MPHALPPLNPMSEAPKNGTPILLMSPRWGLKPAWWDGSQGVWIVPLFIREEGAMTSWIRDDECLGWWPMPEMKEPSR